MCGIIAALLKSKEIATASVADVRERLNSIAHRGPDSQGVVQKGSVVMAHARLAIVDVDSGAQPFERKNQLLAVNGEIYNWRKIRELLPDFEYETMNDCEVILALCSRFFDGSAQRMRGQYAFVWAHIDDSGNLRRWVAARDPVGIAPLYYAKTTQGIYFASELKAITGLPGADLERSLNIFPPGHVMCGDGAGMFEWAQPRAYFKPQWLVDPTSSWIIPRQPDIKHTIRSVLTNAVRMRLMSDDTAEIGAFLSGGLDSSLVASIAAATIRDKPLHTFCVSMAPDAPDRLHAKAVAEHIGSIHHDVIMTIDDGMKVLPHVIRHLESVDVTSVRASTPMYLLCDYIKRNHPNIKVMLSGEGADESWCGYLESHAAPLDGVESGMAAVKRVAQLHMFDVNRCNKTVCAHGLEIRVPFLDESVLEVAMTTWPASRLPQHYAPSKRRMEKHLLRSAFEGKVFDISTTSWRSYLPDEILYRQKEQFSDGCSYSWIDSLKAVAAEGYGDPELHDKLEETFGRRPCSDEQAMIMKLCQAVLPHDAIRLIGAETENWAPHWTEDQDPSGRATLAHKQLIHGW